MRNNQRSNRQEFPSRNTHGARGSRTRQHTANCFLRKHVKNIRQTHTHVQALPFWRNEFLTSVGSKALLSYRSRVCATIFHVRLWNTIRSDHESAPRLSATQLNSQMITQPQQYLTTIKASLRYARQKKTKTSRG